MLFLRGSQLMARAFDIRTAALSSEPVFLAEPLQTGPSFSASENGVLIFRRSQGARVQLTWFGRQGEPLGMVGDAGTISYPKIAPDQKSAAFTQMDGVSSNIWLFDGERGNATRFTSSSDTSWIRSGHRTVPASPISQSDQTSRY